MRIKEYVIVKMIRWK